jgi:hypothetical protein
MLTSFETYHEHWLCKKRIYGRRERGLFEEKSPQFDANCITKIFALNDRRSAVVYLRKSKDLAVGLN